MATPEPRPGPTQRAHVLGYPGAAGDPADDPPGAMPVQAVSIGSQEDRSFAAFTGREVNGPSGTRGERDGTYLAALACDDERPVAAFDAHGLDIGAGGFGNPQPVQRQQGDQRVLRSRAESRGDQQRPQFVSVQPHCVGFVIDARTADMGGGGMVEQFFFDGVTVKPGDGR